MSDPRFRARVTRLLRSDFRVDDLKTLFLYARDRCDGSEAVREVGDFIAHHDERTKGIVTRSVRDWFTVTRFMAPRFMPNAPPFDEWRLPPQTPAYLKAAFRRQTAVPFKQRSGMSLTTGRHALERLLRRFEQNLDGTLRFTRFLLPDEQRLFQVLTNSIDAVYAFSGDELFSDFRASLMKNKILMKTEHQDFNILAEPVVLLAISVMHNNDIVMEDKSKMRLTAQPSHNEGLLQVFAEVTTGIVSQKPISMSSPIFGGKVLLANCLSAELFARDAWDTEIELRDDGKLHDFR